MRKLKLLTILLLSLMISVATTAVQADMMLDFLIDNNPLGTGNITDVAGVATGSSIIVTSVSGWNTPLNSGNTLVLTNAFLNFQVSYTALGTNVADFISISSGGPQYVYAGFNQISQAGVYPNSGPDRVFVATFNDTKAPSLVTQYFGLAAPQYASILWDGFLQVYFDKGSTISMSGSVSNSTAPIPGSLLLLGSGILGLVGIGIRKRA